MINFKTDLMSTFVSYVCFFFSDQDEKVFMEQTEQKKWKHTLATGHYSCDGDECTYVKGHYIVERMQINMLFAAALHILYLLTFLCCCCCCYWREGVTPLVQDCQDHCNSDIS